MVQVDLSRMSSLGLITQTSAFIGLYSDGHYLDTGDMCDDANIRSNKRHCRSKVLIKA